MGSSREVALWGGRDFWVRSSNPGVVPSPPLDGRTAAMYGDLQIITVEGKNVGTSMLEAGQAAGAPWPSLQVQVQASADAGAQSTPRTELMSGLVLASMPKRGGRPVHPGLHQVDDWAAVGR